MRLKDAALLKWKEIDGGFIEITPYKTKKAGNKARIPVSNTLRKMLEERCPAKKEAIYVLPEIANEYGRDNATAVSQKAKRIFEKVYGKKNTGAN